MTNERWTPVRGFAGLYEVSDQGRVRSFTRGSPPVLMRSKPNLKGYHQISLKGSMKSVHRLVLEAFVGPCPEGHEGAHGNGVRSDNRLENLRWATKPEQHKDRHRHGTDLLGERGSNVKLTWPEVREIRRVFGGESTRSLAARFGVHPSTIDHVVKGLSWPLHADPETRLEETSR